jgi:tetratricopeptide (TPR) repeat protein
LALIEDRFEDSITLLKEQLESYRVVGNNQGIDRALYNLVLVLNMLGQYEESLVWAEEAAERTSNQKATNDINQMASTLANIVGIQAFLGLTQLAEQNYQPVIDWLLAGGQGFGAIFGWETLGQLRREQQRYSEAFTAFENVRQARANAGSNPFFYLYSAEAAYLSGHEQQAVKLLEEVSPNIPPERQDYTASVFYYIKYLVETQVMHLEQARFMVLQTAAKLKNPKYRHDVIHKVVFNKDIHKHWQQQDLTTITAELSRPDGIGTRQITWTIDSGASDQAHLEQSGKVALRHHRLKRLSLEAAVQDAIPTQEDFAQALGVTLRTIENDLATLRANGMEIRTLGMQKEVVKK